MTVVILTLLYLWLKYCGNLPSYYSYLLSFQGKFNLIKVTTVILPKMAVNYCSITVAPGAANVKPFFFNAATNKIECLPRQDLFRLL